MADSIANKLVGIVAEGTNNMSSNLKAGADLAQGIMAVQDRRKELELQKQQLQMQKVDKLTSAMEVGAKIPSKSARNAYFKEYIPKMQAALGLQDFIPAETMAMIQADPEQAKKFSLLKTMIMNDEIDFNGAVAKMEPEAWAMLDDKEVLQLEAAEKFRIQQQEATKRANAPGGRLSDQFDRREISKLNNEVRAAFKPIEDKRTSLRTAHDSLIAIQNDLKAGKKASSIDFNVAARMLAKAANSGAMTDEDVNDFKRLAGVEDMTEASIKKYLTGGAPQAAVDALMNIAIRSANNLDRQAATIQEGFKARISLFPDQEQAMKGSGIDAYTQPTLGGKPAADSTASKMYNIGGRDYTAEQVKAIVQKTPAARGAIDPKTLKELGL